MKTLLSFALISLLLGNTHAGNGVERGRIIVSNNFDLKPVIANYLESKLSTCSIGLIGESFKVDSLTVKKDRVDQGIVDLYYKMDVTHLDQNGISLNKLSVEIEDSDYSNWRRYEEKLSFEILNDENNHCL